MRKLIMLVMFFGVTTLGSCSGLAPLKNCIDCNQFPLVYQGTIVEYTKGVYIETACLTIDLSKFTGYENFVIGDIIFIEYNFKNGDFCSPEDKSLYNIYTVKNDKDSEWPTRLIGPGEGITIK